MKKKAEAVAMQSAQQFLNVESITGRLIYTRDRYVIGFLSLHGADCKLLDTAEREGAMRQLSNVLKDEKSPWQIISIPRTVDVQHMVEDLQRRDDAATQETMHTLLRGEIDAMQQLTQDGAKEPFLILKLWCKAATGADRQLGKRLEAICNHLSACKITARRLENREIKWLCRLYANLDDFVPRDDSDTDVPILAGQQRLYRSRIPENEEARLLNAITPPGGFTFGNNTLQIGNTLARCYGIIKYPSEVSYGWLVPLLSNLSAVTCLTYYPGNAAELGDALSKSIRQSASAQASSTDARTQKQFLRRIEGADRMIDALDSRGQTIGHISIVVMPFAADEKGFKDCCDRSVNIAGAGLMRLKSLGNLQKDAYKHISPYYINQLRIDQMLKQIIPLDTVTGGEPCTVTLLRDDGGAYFGTTPDGSPICVNLQYRGQDRTNGNLVAIGTTGSGKSTALKHLLETLYMSGVKVIVIDPEREYRDLCRNLGGAWLDAGGGVAKANPLDIRAVPEDDEDEENCLFSSNANAMDMHIKTLLLRLRLQIPSLTDLQLAMLEDSLLSLYEQCGIPRDVDTTALQPQDYPIMLDWCELLREHGETDAAYRELAQLLQSMATGASAYLWNGHTNIDLDAPFVVIDTNRLQNFSAEAQSSIYFNLLSMCWDAASRNRDKPCVILAEEGHILFDPRLPEVGMYVRNMAKRVRKYESALWLATQSVDDLLNDAVRLAGQAIVDNSAYRLLFRCDAKNLDDTVELFRLTAAEAKLLSSFERRNALCLIGAQHHIRTVFDLPQYKLDLMGRGGGR